MRRSRFSAPAAGTARALTSQVGRDRLFAAARALTSPVRRHRPFAAALALAAALRVVTMLGYREAQTYYYDSYQYLATAAHPGHPVPIREFHPSGYPLFLWLLLPLHSLTVVAAAQHLLGLSAGVLLYATARRRGLPAWGAVLGTLPVLFDASFLWLEHSVLSDELFIFLTVAAITALMWSPRLSAGRAAAAGALLASAAMTRTIALPLLAMLIGYLAVRRAGWRCAAAFAMAGALPIAVYAGWYEGHYGRFTVDSGDGVALWARTMTFANCRVIKPPPGESPLCPDGARQSAASEYLWPAGSPVNRMPGGRASFATDDLARSFALHAILAQPGGYLRAVSGDVALAFPWTPVPHPKRVQPAFYFGQGRWTLAEAQHPMIRQALNAYAPGTVAYRSVWPYAAFLVRYQHIAYLRGPVLAALLALGALGLPCQRWRHRRRSGPSPPPWTLLPLGTAVYLLVAPVAVLDFDHRYVLPAVPFSCLAAALSIASFRRGGRPASHPVAAAALPVRTEAAVPGAAAGPVRTGTSVAGSTTGGHLWERSSQQPVPASRCSLSPGLPPPSARPFGR